MDSILVVCYSYTGTARRVAHMLAANHGWPLGEIQDAKPRAGRSGYLRSVLDSLLRRHPAIRYDGPEPGDFRTVVLVSPIWAFRLAGPMRSFVARHREQLARVAVVSTMGGAGASNAVAEIAQILGRSPIDAAAFTQAEVDDGSANARILDFGDGLVPPSTATQHPHVPAVHLTGAHP